MGLCVPMQDASSFSFGVHCSEYEVSGVLKASEQPCAQDVKSMISSVVCVPEDDILGLFQGYMRQLTV